MKPFAYEQPRGSNRSKLILILLAGTSFSIWYFDLVPQLASVETGRLDSDRQSQDDDFLAMLQSPGADSFPEPGSIVDHRTDDETGSDSDAALFEALESQTEPIENTFPEFASAQQTNAPPFDMTEPESAAINSTGVQQTAFAQSDPAFVTPAISTTVVLDPDTAAKLRNVDDRMLAGEILEAHAILSRLYWKQPEVRPMIQERLETSAAEIYANPNAHFAKPHVVEFGETLDGIAKQLNVPWQYLARLNAVTPETLQAGQSLKVLNGPFGAVVDLERFEMTIHAHGWYVRRYRIGIGKDRQTPTGDFKIQDKIENPTWYPPEGGVIDGDDPLNPLGEYWLGLGDHIGIHGTIDPNSIGAAVSRGCIHLADADIVEVYELLGVGSEVVIRK